MSPHPPAFIWTKCGGSGAAGGIWDHTFTSPLPQAPRSSPARPRGSHTSPTPPCHSGAGLLPAARPPWGGRGCQDSHGPPGCAPPRPPAPQPHASIVIVCPCPSRTDGRPHTVPHPPGTVFIPPVCAWCDVSLRLCPVWGRVYSPPPTPAPVPETVGDPRPPPWILNMFYVARAHGSSSVAPPARVPAEGDGDGQPWAGFN